MTITLSKLETAAELAEALYYAQASALLVQEEPPRQRPATIKWEELSPRRRELWEETARRLIAMHG